MFFNLNEKKKKQVRIRRTRVARFFQKLKHMARFISCFWTLHHNFKPLSPVDGGYLDRETRFVSIFGRLIALFLCFRNSGRPKWWTSRFQFGWNANVVSLWASVRTVKKVYEFHWAYFLTFHFSSFQFLYRFFSMTYLSFTQDNKRENRVVETEIKMLKQFRCLRGI